MVGPGADGGTGLPRLSGYAFDFRRAEQPSRDLVVAFSPGRNFAFYRHRFGRDALFIADRKLRYYLREARPLAQMLVDFIERGGYRRVLFAGSSKGGFGAISIAKLCAELRPNRAFHVVAFSPQVRLWPKNRRLAFDSYDALLRVARRNNGIARALDRRGDLSGAGATPNLVLRIVYARHAEDDREEALALRGRDVEHHPVEGATHGTTFHFMAQGQSREELRARIRRAYRRTNDKDLRRTRPADIDAMVEEVMASALREPTLNELFSEVLGRRPSRMRPRGLAGALLRVAARFGAPVEKWQGAAPAKS